MSRLLKVSIVDDADGDAELAETRGAEQRLEHTAAALARTEMLRLFAHMAASISHDLKNLMNPISLYLDLADRALARGDLAKGRATLADIRHVIQVGTETIDHLRVFGEPTSELVFSRLDLDAVAREAIVLAGLRLRAAGRCDIEIRAELAGTAFAQGEKLDLVSATFNLITNAIEAMPGGGVVKVSTGRDEDRSWIEVQDGGAGMNEELRSRMFEPFFSTKSEPDAGLGLAVVQSALLRNEGEVSVSSELGCGTTVRLSLPVAADTAGG